MKKTIVLLLLVMMTVCIFVAIAEPPVSTLPAGRILASERTDKAEMLADVERFCRELVEALNEKTHRYKEENYQFWYQYRETSKNVY